MLRVKNDTSDLKVFLKDYFSRLIYSLSSKPINSSKIRAISKKEEKVVEKALELNIPTNRIPFLVVFPYEYMPLKDQLDLIVDPRGGCGIEFKPENMKDESQKFDLPYFIFGVENGRDTQGIPCNDMKERFRKSNDFLPLSAAEVISVAMFDGSLEDRNLLALNSICKNGTSEEYVLLRTNGQGDVKTLVSAPPAHIFYQHTGFPSCMHREEF